MYDRSRGITISPISELRARPACPRLNVHLGLGPRQEPGLRAATARAALAG